MELRACHCSKRRLRGTNPLEANKTVHISGMALLFLGIGLLGQAAITTWALKATPIPTWSTNPLDLVYALSDTTNPRQLQRRRGRCMMSVHQCNDPADTFYPLRRQQPPITAHPEEIWILGFIWLLFLLAALWGGIIQTMIAKGNKHGILGQSWALLPQFSGRSLNDCSAARCTDGTSVLNISWTSRRGQAGMVGTIFLICAFQAVVTLSLHCDELLADVLQDKYVFRAVVIAKGTDARYNSLKADTWRNRVLAVFKIVTHWIFGLSINVGYLLGVNMYPPQIFYFAVVMFVFASYATFLSLEKPVGALPATYGHLQTILDLIDVWEDRMFWGHKESGSPNYAGTSHTRLQMPHYNELYGERQTGEWSNGMEQFEVQDNLQGASFKSVRIQSQEDETPLLPTNLLVPDGSHYITRTYS
ncbi:uncharacterized protein PAC_16727 [Phialocephala subalpina]|uniref:Uncharacterized protein n=1 Tax=Phialocephala subalpina TaxID=576137 RepID=A0A1L7XPH0_9HELO|nr:uncharacterized protein PAC_16727 [Phialocephala subalpina]